MLSLLLTFLFATNPAGADESAAARQRKDAQCEFLMLSKIAGQSPQEWLQRARFTNSQLALSLTRNGIVFRKENMGLLDSLYIEPRGSHPANLLARNLFETRDGLRLQIATLPFLAYRRLEAYYNEYSRSLPSLLSMEDAGTDELRLLTSLTESAHTLVIKGGNAQFITSHSLNIQHELNHEVIDRRRHLYGADSNSAYGRYSANYSGPSYGGYLSAEEARVRLADVARLAQAIRSETFPGMLSQLEFVNYSFDIPFKNDREIFTAIFERMRYLLDIGESLARAGEAFDTRPPPVEFISHNGKVWARFIQTLYNKDGSPAKLSIAVPISDSSGKDDPTNMTLLAQEMRGHYERGLALNNLATFIQTALAPSGQGHSAYPQIIAFLKTLTTYRPLADADGHAILAPEYRRRFGL